MQVLWVEPVLPKDEPQAALAAVPSMLTVPMGWQSGDPAAVLIAELPGPELWREQLVPELLAAGAAVLELDVQTPRGVAADNAAAPSPPVAEELLPDLFGALRALRAAPEPAGAVLAFGIPGAGGAAVLRAGEVAALHHFGQFGPRFAALAMLAEGCAPALAEPVTAGWQVDAVRMATTVANGSSLYLAAPSRSGTAAIGAPALTCAVALVPPSLR